MRTTQYPSPLYTRNHKTHSALKVALLGALSLIGTAQAAQLIYQNVDKKDFSYEFGDAWNVTNDDRVYGLFASNGFTATLTGQNINISVQNTNTIGSADWEDNTTKAYGLIAGYSTTDKNSTVLLGDDNTDRITIDVSTRGWAYGIGTFGDNAHKQYGHPNMKVSGKTLVLNVHSDECYAYGIIAQNGTTDDTDRAHTVINTENTYVTVTADMDPDNDIGAHGLVVMSQGQLDVNGNLYVIAESPKGGSALTTRGDAITNINVDGKHTVQMTGDVRFDYSDLNSLTKVDATVNLTLSNADSFLDGNILVSGNPPTGKDQVLDMNLTLSNGGTWTPSANSFVNRLTMENGRIEVKDAKATIDVLNEFSGHGNLVLAAEENQDGFSASGFRLAEGVVPTEGSSLAITYSGITSDDIENLEQNLAELSSGVVAEGVKQTRIITEGDIRGAIVETVDENGKTIGTSVGENTKLDAFEGVNAATLIQWRNEINHLTQRLGDIRDEQSTMGAWARVYGGESSYSDTVNVNVNHATVQVGLDGRLGSWIVGGAFSYTDSDADITNGESKGDG